MLNILYDYKWLLRVVWASPPTTEKFQKQMRPSWKIVIHTAAESNPSRCVFWVLFRVESASGASRERRAWLFFLLRSHLSSAFFKTGRTHTRRKYRFLLSLLFVPLWFQTPHVLVLAQITGCWNITSAIKTIWKMTDLLFSGWSDINKFFLQAATLLQTKSAPAASCSSPPPTSSTSAVFGSWQEKKKEKKKKKKNHKNSCWQDYSHKRNRAHVAVAVNANFASILRAVLDTKRAAWPPFSRSLTVIIAGP